MSRSAPSFPGGSPDLQGRPGAGPTSRIGWLASLGAAIILVFGLVSLGRVPDPVYQGKPLSLHLRAFSEDWDQRAEEHCAGILALSTFGRRASNAIPVLLDCLSSTNVVLQGTAAIALSRIGCPPGKALPTILSNLSATVSPLAYPVFPPASPTPAAMAAWNSQNTQAFRLTSSRVMLLLAIKEYGSDAQSALPVLTNLRTYPVGNIQAFARDLAAEIKMSALSKAP